MGAHTYQFIRTLYEYSSLIHLAPFFQKLSEWCGRVKAQRHCHTAFIFQILGKFIYPKFIQKLYKHAQTAIKIKAKNIAHTHPAI